MPGTQGWSRWRFVIAPRWLAWHLFMVASVAGMLALGNWQLQRAQAGNSLSWAYTFEWPFFAILAVVFWAKTLRDEAHPPAPPENAERAVQLPAGVAPGNVGGAEAGASEPVMSAEDEELAAYNAYLARLQREVRGHGKWHGLR
jgi:DNA-binding transcriptional regulator of glucitol operon